MVVVPRALVGSYAGEAAFKMSRAGADVRTCPTRDLLFTKYGSIRPVWLRQTTPIVALPRDGGAVDQVVQFGRTFSAPPPIFLAVSVYFDRQQYIYRDGGPVDAILEYPQHGQHGSWKYTEDPWYHTRTNYSETGPRTYCLIERSRLVITHTNYLDPGNQQHRTYQRRSADVLVFDEQAR